MAYIDVKQVTVNENAPAETQVKQLKSWVTQLAEQMKYAFANLDDSNFSNAYKTRMASIENLASSTENILDRLKYLAEKRSLAALLDQIDGKVTISIQEDEPSGAVENDLWYDTAESPTIVYKRVSGVWVDVTTYALEAAIEAASAAQATADGKITTFTSDEEPATGMSDGDMWFDTDDGNKPYRYNAEQAAWVAVNDSRFDGIIASNAAYIASLTQYVYIEETDTTSRLIIKKPNSNFYVSVDGTEIGFHQGSAKIAWISNSTLHISMAYIDTTLTHRSGSNRFVQDASSDPGHFSIAYMEGLE